MLIKIDIKNYNLYKIIIINQNNQLNNNIIIIFI